ncbi:Amylopullulanase precursor [compost metagenome]
MFWEDTGASSYNIKRATTQNGPYALLASNITGTSYVDRNVNNKTPYYYVISSVNPAGESADSPQKMVTPELNKYTGGLLDGITLDTGRTVGTSTSTERRVTDNNTGTRTAQLSTGTLLWYTFSSPKEINAIIINRYSGTATVEFYDVNNNLLSTYVPTANDTVEALETPVSNVTTVVLKTTSTGYITEWNVFGSGIEVEVPVEELGLSATAGNSKVQLSWSAVSTATSYKIQRSTTSGGPYSVIDTVSSSTYSYTDNNVVNSTTYYYIVTAVGAAGDLVTSNEASATPRGEVVPPIEENSGDRALLFIMLSTGEIKEYDLSMNEVNAFIQWYETRATGVGPITFAIDKHNNNKGPFTNRKDYIIYDKIITFEVNAYEIPNSTSPTPPTSPIEH